MRMPPLESFHWLLFGKVSRQPDLFKKYNYLPALGTVKSLRRWSSGSLLFEDRTTHVKGLRAPPNVCAEPRTWGNAWGGGCVQTEGICETSCILMFPQRLTLHQIRTLIPALVPSLTSSWVSFGEPCQDSDASCIMAYKARRTSTNGLCSVSGNGV